MLSSTVIIREGGTYEAFTTPQIWPAVLFVCAFLFTCARLKEMIKSAFFWGSLVPVGRGVFVWFLTHRYLAFTRYAVFKTLNPNRYWGYSVRVGHKLSNKTRVRMG